MKKSWPTEQLVNLCEMFADGDWIESKDQSVDGIRIIQTGNVGEGIFKGRDDKARYISEPTFKRLRCTEIFEGDCLVSRLPEPAGRSCILPDTGERMITSVDCTIVRFNTQKIIPAFFNFYSQSREYLKAIDCQTTGTTRKRISRSKLGCVLTPVPPLSEQQRIVAILDEIFDGIAKARANAEKNQQNARKLFESHLQSKLAKQPDWEGKTLKQVSLDFGRGKSKHRPRNDPRLYGGPYPFIQTSDVRGCEHLITDFTQTYSEAGLAQSKLWPKGTLCITIAANIAETGILGFDSCFPDSVIGVVVDPTQTSNSFLEYLLQSVKASLKAKGKGSAQDNINLATFENEPFYFPDLAEQKQIVDQLSDLNAEAQRLESIYQQKLAALDELKQSLLHQAFSGKL
ncbi:restriction endonuclease subunit S [Stutzerimonas stutzeri]|uniref:restriction endonuclease subunit S n=1 Tax=Stutzerimonas TaxID=2901164 RepID=UPI001BB08DCC|nr:restriction endonuclease subunit S [Stutzerimonas stutzeri]QUE75686.1 restriction endonuclease subunit S [Stutzerimonas stutzeri]